MNPGKKKTEIEGRTARLNLRIQPDLQQWVHDYAKRTGKSVSGIVVDHFCALREIERGVDVKQI